VCYVQCLKCIKRGSTVRECLKLGQRCCPVEVFVP